MSEAWRIALIDSGCNDAAIRRPVSSLRFTDTGAGIATSPVGPDSSGHGTRIANIVCSGAAVPDLLIAQVLAADNAATAAATAAAVRWALEEGANLLHMSLGLRRDRDVLAAAIAAAAAALCLVVAATPARGEPTYPARYPNVLRATGDARCAVGQISALDPGHAFFGACPHHAAHPRAGGASIGAAHLTRFIVTHLAPGAELGEACALLQRLADFHGAERRLSRPAAAIAPGK